MGEAAKLKSRLFKEVCQGAQAMLAMLDVCTPVPIQMVSSMKYQLTLPINKRITYDRLT